MTWMPDRGSAPRGRQHSNGNSTQRSAHRPEWADDHGPGRDGSHDGGHKTGFDGRFEGHHDGGFDGGFDGAGGHPRTAQRQLGIPHILGRRARWVGARLRRDT
ncbi:hypothetical protein ACFVFS_30165 [Kitasatospora sp. NPDC057692]|uniref:hypothetical protein n=1 Tax=Kitasatospora sp. NPDC057692 TaxID=3346215 RepID=UPI0036CC58B6